MEVGAPAGTTPRILPPLTDTNRYFWTGGRKGRLMLVRDTTTGRFFGPSEAPAPDDRFQPQPVSGRGTVFTFTVNRHQYHPQVPPPYVISLVELDEQEGLRIPANIVNCDIDEVHVGMRVAVSFEDHGEHAVPVFEPAPADS